MLREKFVHSNDFSKSRANDRIATENVFSVDRSRGEKHGE